MKNIWKIWFYNFSFTSNVSSLIALKLFPTSHIIKLMAGKLKFSEKIISLAFQILRSQISLFNLRFAWNKGWRVTFDNLPSRFLFLKAYKFVPLMWFLPRFTSKIFINLNGLTFFIELSRGSAVQLNLL